MEPASSVHSNERVVPHPGDVGEVLEPSYEEEDASKDMHEEHRHGDDNENTCLGWFKLEILIDQSENEGLIFETLNELAHSHNSDDSCKLYHLINPWIKPISLIRVNLTIRMHFKQPSWEQSYAVKEHMCEHIVFRNLLDIALKSTILPFKGCQERHKNV